LSLAKRLVDGDNRVPRRSDEPLIEGLFH
jgi:hypothetical protein